jgi:predicted kinase
MEPSDTTKPHLIIMVGIPGAGKSFFAQHFAETFNAPIISFDLLRHEIFTKPLQNESEDIILSNVANLVLGEMFKTKRTIIYEGRTNQRADRMEISKKSRQAGYEPLFIWVQTETITASKRATKSTDNKPAISIDEFNNKLKKFSSPHHNEKAIVISGKHTYASQLKIVLKNLIQASTNDNGRKILDNSSKSRNYLIR